MTTPNFNGYGISAPQLHAVLDFVNAVGSVASASASNGQITINPVDITANHALAAADFGTGVIRISGAGVAITVPTVAVMGLAATPGVGQSIMFHVRNGTVPTFAGADLNTTINGVVGPTTVLPLGGAPVNYGHYVLTQDAPGSNTWSLS